MREIVGLIKLIQNKTNDKCDVSFTRIDGVYYVAVNYCVNGRPRRYGRRVNEVELEGLKVDLWGRIAEEVLEDVRREEL